MNTAGLLSALSVAAVLLAATPAPRPHHGISFVRKVRAAACRPSTPFVPRTGPHAATITTNGKSITTVENRGTVTTRTTVCRKK